ncbi:MAG: hypothetical protein ACYSU6_06855 [Planctomycetota bacterium]|jgi:hypothetical protein
MNRENVEEVLKKLGAEDVPVDVHRIAEEASEDFNKTLTPLRQHILWSDIMKSPITKLAAAAVIIIAVLTAIHYSGGSIDGASVAFGDVLEKIYNARTVTYKQTFEPERRPSFTTERMIIEPGLIRSVMPHGDITILDFSSGKSLNLMVQAKSAIITQRVGEKRGRRLFNYLDWLEDLDEGAEFIGQEEVDGQMTEVFVSEVPFERTTVWVNPETDLPVKVEQRMIPNVDKDIIFPIMHLSASDFGQEKKTYTYTDNGGQKVTMHTMTRSISIGSSRGSGKGIQEKMTVTMHDFAWDVELDESLFSLEPPEGYTVEEEQFDVSDRGENGLIYALAFWAEMSDGAFPLVINDLGDPNKVRPLLIEKFDRDGDPGEELDLAMKEMHRILKGLYFSQEKKVDGSWGYAGDGVQLGEADKPICWWTNEGSETWRVIYGDLSVGDSEEAPELQEGR